MGASAGAGPALASAVPVRRNMTDNVPQGGNGSGEGETAAPQPWFPPSGEPGGYGQPPPFDPGQPPAGGYGQPAGGQPGQPAGGQPGGFGQQGYGPQGGPGQRRYAPWPSQPQAPKPGVIPLRPLGVGEILDGAFTSIRRNPRATLGIAAQQLTDAQAQHLLTRMGEVLGPTAGVSIVLAFIVDTVLTGLLTVVIGRSVLGYKITAGEAWQIARPRMAALVGATLLIPLILIGLWVVYAIVLVGLALLHAPGALIGWLAALGAIAGIVLTIWFTIMFRMAGPAVVLEREGPVRALKRSWRLIRGSFWRVFGITGLAGLIVVVTAGVLQIPFSVAAALTGSGNSVLPGTGGTVAGILISAVGGVVAGAVARPISAGVAVLLYVDLRMRREGLDLILQTAASGDEFASLWRPGARTAQPGPGAGPGVTGAGLGTGPVPGTGPGQGTETGQGMPPGPG